jgi:F0F1-type ATP synthase assembly protein I
MSERFFDLRARREMHNGFGDALARAFELVVTPLVFAVLGWLLDGWLGTRPVFTVVLAVFAVAGVVIRMYYGYELEMRRHEQEGPWAKRS